MNERRDRPGKVRDAAIALPLLGLFLLMPPMISLFATPAGWHGIPLIVLYLFGIWAALIACAVLLALRLGRMPAADADSRGETPDRQP